MRIIKKYANRKLYDTHDKKHISRDKLADLIKQGEEVSVIDNRNGEDITVSIISQLIGMDDQDADKALSPRLLMQLLRKGSDTLTDYTKKYVSLWQGAFNMAEDEIDKLVGRLVKNKELSNDEGSRLKKEIIGYTDGIKNWVGESVDKRVSEVFDAMNLATHDHIEELSARIDDLTKKVHQLEKTKKASPRRKQKTGVAKPKPKRKPKSSKKQKRNPSI